ncbi:hypothetical protein BHE74_00008117 [Ensete ventricosum]|nr:hypothetical protein GW17_00030107 [Ensete ventricosum]RWW83374.1 hypothetical protein BHE74_00008117 [Ensete ventricosum]RZS14064.1 hypothetical protein BHM03_00045721 [Ensete ventricosum]
MFHLPLDHSRRSFSDAVAAEIGRFQKKGERLVVLSPARLRLHASHHEIAAVVRLYISTTLGSHLTER